MNLTTRQTKTQHHNSRAAADALQPRKSADIPVAEFTDTRPAAAGQRALQRVMLGNAGSASVTANKPAKAGTLQKINLAEGGTQSEATLGQEIGDNSVVTATKVGGGFGHTRLLFEHRDAISGLENSMVELTASGTSATTSSTTRSPTDTTSSSSGSSSSRGPSYSSGSRGERIGIEIKHFPSIQRNLGQATARHSRTVTNALATGALTEAARIQTNKDIYRYETMATESSFGKNKMNCASFGEQVLRQIAPGLNASNTVGIKTPGKLVSGW